METRVPRQQAMDMVLAKVAAAGGKSHKSRLRTACRDSTSSLAQPGTRPRQAFQLLCALVSLLLDTENTPLI